jgi:sorting nexin-1/2
MKLQDDATEDIFVAEDPKSAQFRVFNPVKVSGHIKYTVSGVDSEGPFEESRRFSEFFALREALASRWPGVYIPAIPEKKLMGNKDDKFVEERRALLERFMKEIAKFEYLTDSKEFKVFARDRGDIEKILNGMTR